jgi:hypothetical protein
MKAQTKQTATQIFEYQIKFRDMCCEDKEIKEAFMTLHDMIRERAEEHFGTLTDRKRAVRRTINKLSRTYW